jgi:hypothetical protein
MTSKGVHDVFHIGLLLKVPKDEIHDRRLVKPPPVMIDSEEEEEVESVIDSRKYRNKLQYLVHWKGTTAEENSWEDIKDLKHAPEAVSDFHQHHPDTPQDLGSAPFG